MIVQSATLAALQTSDSLADGIAELLHDPELGVERPEATLEHFRSHASRRERVGPALARSDEVLE